MTRSPSVEERFGALSDDKARLVELLLNRGSSAVAELVRFERPENVVPLLLRASGAQQRLWFIDKLEGASSAYHVSLAVRLRGVLDTVAMELALDDLLRRHESLRTAIVEADGVPMQEIVPHARFQLQRFDLSAHEPEHREVQLRRQLVSEAAVPFVLEHAPLIRGTLFRVGASEHVLLMTMHHIVSDGWSIDVIRRDLSALYEARCKGVPDTLPALDVQYADYARWQHDQLCGSHVQEQLAYWKEHLHGAPELLELPTDRRRPPTQSYRGAAMPVALGLELSSELRWLARRSNVTLAMMLCAAWSIVLARFSGQGDLVIGMPVANRPKVELEGLIGLFVNTLPLRVQLDDAMTVAQLLARVKELMLSAYSHRDVPFEQLVETLQPTRSLSHAPLFQVTFVLQNASHATPSMPGLESLEEEVPLRTAQFDLSLSLQETASGIRGNLVHATDLFDAATIERWVECFATVLRNIVRDPGARVSDLSLLSEQQRRTVLDSCNATETAYPQEELLHTLFARQAETTPAAVAVVGEGGSLTYAELEARANRLASLLVERGTRPDQPVGICVERGLDMFVGLLGIWKAGGAYVPLDPDYPQDRLASMLDDAALLLV